MQSGKQISASGHRWISLCCKPQEKHQFFVTRKHAPLTTIHLALVIRAHDGGHRADKVGYKITLGEAREAC